MSSVKLAVNFVRHPGKKISQEVQSAFFFAISQRKESSICSARWYLRDSLPEAYFPQYKFFRIDTRGNHPGIS
jgi:hypothetical protein